MRQRLLARSLRGELAEVAEQRRRTGVILAELEAQGDLEAANMLSRLADELDQLIETKEARLSELQPVPEPSPPPDEGTPPAPAPVPEPYPPPDEATPPSIPQE